MSDTKIINLLYSKDCYCFEPFVNNFQYILQQNGYTVSIITLYDPLLDDTNVLWIVWPGNMTLLPKRCIIYNMDLIATFIKSYLSNLIKHSQTTNNTCILGVYDFTFGENIVKLQDLCDSLELHITVQPLPFGYSSYYATLGDKSLCKDIDVLFYGNLSYKRIDVTDYMKEFCLNKGYEFICRWNDLFDEHQKANVISRSKIVISIKSDEFYETIGWECNDLPRISQALSTGEFVITEYRGDKIVESLLSNYVPHFSTINELCDMIEYYLEHPKEREYLLALSTYNYKKDFNLETLLCNIVRQHTTF